MEEKKQEHQDLRKTCLLNSSVASNKLGEYKITINKCTEVTYIDDKNPKCYYLRAQAYSKLKDYDQALTDIKEAIRLNPSDKNIRDEFEAIKGAKKKEADHEKELAKQLFSQGLYNEKAAPVKQKKADGLPEFKV